MQSFLALGDIFHFLPISWQTVGSLDRKLQKNCLTCFVTLLEEEITTRLTNTSTETDYSISILPTKSKKYSKVGHRQLWLHCHVSWVLQQKPAGPNKPCRYWSRSLEKVHWDYNTTTKMSLNCLSHCNTNAILWKHPGRSQVLSLCAMQDFKHDRCFR